MVTHHHKSRSSRMKNININRKGTVRELQALPASLINTGNDNSQPFLMPVEDVFFITGRGTVVYGRIERGIIKVGEEVEIVGIRDTTTSLVTGVEMFKTLFDEGRAGDNVGLLLRDIKKEDIERGMVICKPGSIKPYKKFKAIIYMLTKEEGGRHTPLFNRNIQFYFRNAEFTGEIKLPSGLEMVIPGDTVLGVTVTLVKPVAMETGLKIDIREGGRTVGRGTVTEIFE